LEFANVGAQIQNLTDRIAALEERLAAVEHREEGLEEVGDVADDHGSDSSWLTIVILEQAMGVDEADCEAHADLDMHEALMPGQTDVLQVIVASLEMLANFVKRSQSGNSST
jgi:hypothetical protein